MSYSKAVKLNEICSIYIKMINGKIYNKKTNKDVSVKSLKNVEHLSNYSLQRKNFPRKKICKT